VAEAQLDGAFVALFDFGLWLSRASCPVPPEVLKWQQHLERTRAASPTKHLPPKALVVQPGKRPIL
jgi:hypothetical protein